MTALPKSPRTNGGVAMLFGAVLVVIGGYMIYLARDAGASGTDTRYLIAYCTAGAGLLCLRRGYDRSAD